MKNELQKHKKSDKIKWAFIYILYILILVAFIGLCLQLFAKDEYKPSKWFKSFECEHVYEDGICTKCGEAECLSDTVACTFDYGYDTTICTPLTCQADLQFVETYSESTSSKNSKYVVHGYLINGGPAPFYSDVLKYYFLSPMPELISVCGLRVNDMWTEVVSYDEYGFECVIYTTNDALFCKELYAEVLLVFSDDNNTGENNNDNTGDNSDNNGDNNGDNHSHSSEWGELSHIVELQVEYNQTNVIYTTLPFSRDLFEDDLIVLLILEDGCVIYPPESSKYYSIYGNIRDYDENNNAELYVYCSRLNNNLSCPFTVNVVPRSPSDAIDIAVDFDTTRAIYSNTVFYEMWGLVSVTADFGDGDYSPVDDFSIKGDLTVYDENNLSEVIVTYGNCQKILNVEVIPCNVGNRPSDKDNTGENNDDNSGDYTGDNSSDNTGDNSGDNNGENTGDNSEDNLDNPGENISDDKKFEFGLPSIDNFKNLFDKDFWKALIGGEIEFLPFNWLSLILGVIGIVLVAVLLFKFISLFSKKNKKKHSRK